MSWLVRQYDSLPPDVNLAKVVPTIKQALLWTKQAWDAVKPETISNCWRHAGILADAGPVIKKAKRLTKQQQQRADAIASAARAEQGDAEDADEMFAAGLGADEEEPPAHADESEDDFDLGGGDDTASEDAGGAAAEDADTADGGVGSDDNYVAAVSPAVDSAIRQQHSGERLAWQEKLLADEVQELELAQKDLLAKMSEAQRAVYEPISVADLLALQDGEEHAGAIRVNLDTLRCELIQTCSMSTFSASVVVLVSMPNQLECVGRTRLHTWCRSNGNDE